MPSVGQPVWQTYHASASPPGPTSLWYAFAHRDDHRKKLRRNQDVFRRRLIDEDHEIMGRALFGERVQEPPREPAKAAPIREAAAIDSNSHDGPLM
jgi:hypothetical protein